MKFNCHEGSNLSQVYYIFCLPFRFTSGNKRKEKRVPKKKVTPLSRDTTLSLMESYLEKAIACHTKLNELFYRTLFFGGQLSTIVILSAISRDTHRRP